jgi:hypothetical protein
MKLKIDKKKVAGWYCVLASSLTLVLIIYSFVTTYFLPLKTIVSILGVVAGILLLKDRSGGLILALIWSVLQIVILQIGSVVINLVQSPYFMLTYFRLVDLVNLPDIIFWPNLVGIALVIILIFWRKDLRNEK